MKIVRNAKIAEMKGQGMLLSGCRPESVHTASHCFQVVPVKQLKELHLYSSF